MGVYVNVATSNEADDQERSKLKSVMKGHTNEIDTITDGVLHLFGIDTIKEFTAMHTEVNGQIKLGSTQNILDQSFFNLLVLVSVAAEIYEVKVVAKCSNTVCVWKYQAI